MKKPYDKPRILHPLERHKWSLEIRRAMSKPESYVEEELDEVEPEEKGPIGRSIIESPNGWETHWVFAERIK